jgi:aspartyl-tRNA(Asn)/glutamyl-tRNA(Gln) amidotransferase subunit A
MAVHYLGIEESRPLLDRGEIRSVELTQAYLERIDRLNPELNAFITVMADLAMRQAAEADRRIAAGERAPLLGIPFAVKDILSVTGVRTTCGSRMLQNYVPVFQGSVIDRLLNQGAVLLGKTNMDEFAMGSSNEHSAFGPVRNPWDIGRVPGGSSGGSAAAVAAGLCAFALGTDTGGSIRQPASLCGTVGVKPTYGRVSRYGLVAFASSLDQIGPITRSVRDAAIVLGEIAGLDPLDSTTIDLEVPEYLLGCDGSLQGLKIGVPEEYMPADLDAGVRSLVERGIDQLRALGAAITPVRLPMTRAALAAYYVVAPSEAMSNLARFDGVRYGHRAEGHDIWEVFDRTREEGFGPEVKRRILIGAFALSAGYYDAYYVKAQQIRALVRRDFENAFAECDVIAGPTSPSVAFRLGERTGDPLSMYQADVFTLPANMAGVCGISVPCGLVEGLPVGLQLLARWGREDLLFQVGAAYEQAAAQKFLPAGVAA